MFPHGPGTVLATCVAAAEWSLGKLLRVTVARLGRLAQPALSLETS